MCSLGFESIRLNPLPLQCCTIWETGKISKLHMSRAAHSCTNRSMCAPASFHAVKMTDDFFVNLLKHSSWNCHWGNTIELCRMTWLKDRDRDRWKKSSDEVLMCSGWIVAWFTYCMENVCMLERKKEKENIWRLVPVEQRSISTQALTFSVQSFRAALRNVVMT